MEGEPRWTQFRLDIELRHLFYLFVTSYHLLICVFKTKKNLFVPVCSQFSNESSWKLVERGFNIHLQTSVEKSDVRKSDVSSRCAMTERVGLGGEEQGCPHCIRPQGTAFPICPDLLRRHSGSIPIRKYCYHLIHKLKNNEKSP